MTNTWQDFATNRTFQLWEYSVSHGRLLIRSPMGPAGGEGSSANIDLMFFDTIYIELPRFIGPVSVTEPTDAEVQRLGRVLGDMRSDSRVFIIESKGHRYVVVAARMVRDTNTKDMMASPFK